MGKAVAAAAEAASKPAVQSAERRPPVIPVLEPPARAGERPTPQRAPRLGKRLHHSFWQPLAVFTGALWLRVTGTFFALIACTLGSAVWRQHAVLLQARNPERHRLWLLLLFSALFGYFAVSGFLRANARERRP